MIVYGDPQFAATAGAFRIGLRTRLKSLRHPEPLSIDELRTLLILFGQLEQAVDDIPNAGPFVDLHTATDIIAGAFVTLLMGKAPDCPFAERLLEILDRLELDDRTALTVKIPE